VVLVYIRYTVKVAPTGAFTQQDPENVWSLANPSAVTDFAAIDTRVVGAMIVSRHAEPNFPPEALRRKMGLADPEIRFQDQSVVYVSRPPFFIWLVMASQIPNP
jgi:hypothetical protein